MIRDHGTRKVFKANVFPVPEVRGLQQLIEIWDN